MDSNEKKLIRKSIFHYIFQFMIFKIFQNCLPLYQWHHNGNNAYFKSSNNLHNANHENISKHICGMTTTNSNKL
jgi:regulatory protein YycI of two-component signal transduction system YycFG